MDYREIVICGRELSQSPGFSLLVIAIVVGTILIIWQRRHPNFDLADLITGPNGKVSLKKMGVASALIVSTWGFASLVQQGKMTEFYFIGYMAVWCGYRAYVETKKPGDKE